MKTARLMFGFIMLFGVGAVHAQSIDDATRCEKVRELPERAIASCTRVIDSGQFTGVNLAIAFHNRGIARTGLGELDAAIADLDMAILINPRAASGFTNRGIAWHGQGEYARAIADYDAAIRLNPKDISALNHRGLAKFFQGEFVLAAADFSTTRELGKPDAYSVIWTYLARTRSGESVQSEFEQAVRELPKDAWPAPVLRVYLGEVGPEALLRAAAHTDPKKQTEQLCEAHYYLGQRRIIRGDPEVATANFEAARNQCPRVFLEYTGATAELKRMK